MSGSKRSPFLFVLGIATSAGVSALWPLFGADVAAEEVAITDRPTLDTSGAFKKETLRIGNLKFQPSISSELGFTDNVFELDIDGLDAAHVSFVVAHESQG